MALPPGPSDPSLVQTYHWIRRPVPYMHELRRRHGDAFTLRMAGIGTFAFFCRQDAIKEIFTANHEDLSLAPIAGDFGVLVGEHSVLVLEGAAHLRQRKLLLPAFHGERMQAYTDVMRKVTDDSIARWPLRRAFPVHHRMQEITLEVILRAVFGVEDGARMRQLADLMARLADRVMTPAVLLPWFRFELGGLTPYGQFVRVSEAVDRVIYDEIARRRKAGDAADRVDVLSMMMLAKDEDGKPMTDRELRDELITLLFAGHETTASALAWAFERLLSLPEIVSRARDEIERVSEGEPLDAACIGKLEYLDGIVKEALRLRPIVPLAPRRVMRPVKIGGFDLPVGCNAAASIYLAHHDERVYPDPERFDPLRFVGKKTDPYTWLPFGGGIRRCIGMAFAQYEMKVVLAEVLRRADLSIAPGPPIRTVRRGLTLVPLGGTPVIMSGTRA
jgi:cytochrome P450